MHFWHRKLKKYIPADNEARFVGINGMRLSAPAPGSEPETPNLLDITRYQQLFINGKKITNKNETFLKTIFDRICASLNPAQRYFLFNCVTQSILLANTGIERSAAVACSYTLKIKPETIAIDTRHGSFSIKVINVCNGIVNLSDPETYVPTTISWDTTFTVTSEKLLVEKNSITMAASLPKHYSFLKPRIDSTFLTLSDEYLKKLDQLVEKPTLTISLKNFINKALSLDSVDQHDYMAFIQAMPMALYTLLKHDTCFIESEKQKLLEVYFPAMLATATRLEKLIGIDLAVNVGTTIDIIKRKFYTEEPAPVQDLQEMRL